MADLGEAFNILKFQKNQFQNIDYFFTQRSLNEEHEYFDKNMNRKIKKNKVIHNFLALNIPLNTILDLNKENIINFDIEIFGDEGYHYKGTLTSCSGIIPNFLIPIKGDKKIFININIIENNISKKFVSFIEVPKRFQINPDVLSLETQSIDDE